MAARCAVVRPGRPAALIASATVAIAPPPRRLPPLPSGAGEVIRITLSPDGRAIPLDMAPWCSTDVQNSVVVLPWLRVPPTRPDRHRAVGCRGILRRRPRGACPSVHIHTRGAGLVADDQSSVPDRRFV